MWLTVTVYCGLDDSEIKRVMQATVNKAQYTTRQHRAQYTTRQHRAQYTTRQHKAQYTTRQHEAQYTTRQHKAQYTTRQHEAQYTTRQHKAQRNNCLIAGQFQCDGNCVQGTELIVSSVRSFPTDAHAAH